MCCAVPVLAQVIFATEHEGYSEIMKKHPPLTNSHMLEKKELYVSYVSRHSPVPVYVLSALKVPHCTKLDKKKCIIMKPV